jgi:hypothetical protein
VNLFPYFCQKIDSLARISQIFCRSQQKDLCLPQAQFLADGFPRVGMEDLKVKRVWPSFTRASIDRADQIS